MSKFLESLDPQVFDTVRYSLTFVLIPLVYASVGKIADAIMTKVPEGKLRRFLLRRTWDDGSSGPASGER